MGYLRQLAFARIFTYVRPVELPRLAFICRDARDSLQNVFFSTHLHLEDRELSILKGAPWLSAWQKRSAPMLVTLVLMDSREAHLGGERGGNAIGTFFYEMCQLGMPKLERLTMAYTFHVDRRWQCSLPSLVFLSIRTWRGSRWTLDAPKLETYGVARGNLLDIEHDIVKAYADRLDEDVSDQPDAVIFNSYFPRGYITARSWAHQLTAEDMKVTQEEFTENVPEIHLKLPPPDFPPGRYRPWDWPINKGDTSRMQRHLEFWWERYSTLLPPDVLQALIDQGYQVNVYYYLRGPCRPWMQAGGEGDFHSLPCWMEVVPLRCQRLRPLPDELFFRWTPPIKWSSYHPIATAFESPNRSSSDIQRLKNLKRLELDLDSPSWRMELKELFPDGTPWTYEDTEVLLKSDLPNGAYNSKMWREVILKMQVRYFALHKCSRSVVSVFWGYLLFHSIWKQTGRRIRVSYPVVAYFPHPWDHMVVQMCAGRYEDCVVGHVLRAINVPEEKVTSYLQTEAWADREAMWKDFEPLMNEVAHDTLPVGSLDGYRLRRFTAWYHQVQQASCRDAFDRVPSHRSAFFVGGLSIAAPWLVDHVSRFAWNDLRKWQVPVVLPVSRSLPYAEHKAEA